jgi:hypothetical protein
MTLVLGEPAAANTLSLSTYNAICISVSDATQTQQFKFRDDIANSIAPRLDMLAQHIRKRMRIYSRPSCRKPGAFGYLNQISLELAIYRQRLSLDGKIYNAAIIGGASSNAQGPLMAYELQPVLLIQVDEPSNDSIANALSEFVETRVLTLLKP